MAEIPPSNLVAALVAAMGELDNVTKANTATVPTKAGGSYSYKYADLGDVLTYIRPVLTRHGLAVAQEISGDGATITVVTVIWHESGESYRTAGLTMRAGGTPQEAGSAITYARRYSLLPALGLATEDDDGAQATHRIEARDRKSIADQHLAAVTFDRLKLVAGTPEADTLKALAKEHGQKLTLAALAAEPEWRITVDNHLNEQGIEAP